MTNITNFFENTNSHRGLYRVWVPLHDDGKAPLICVWIDPSMTGFESEPCTEDAGISAEDDGRPAGIRDTSKGEYPCAA